MSNNCKSLLQFNGRFPDEPKLAGATVVVEEILYG